MSERSEHSDRWNDELAAYALDSLDEREVALVETHVGDCEICAERLRWLAPAVDMLPAAVPQRQPSPELRTRLMEVVNSEAAPPRTADKPVEQKRSLLERLGLSGWSMRPALAGLAAVLLIAAGVAGYSLRDDDSTDSRTYTAVATDERSLASGMLEVDGDQGSLRVSNLPPAGKDEVYQAWVQHVGPNGRTTPSSVFVVHDDGVGEVSIPSGLEGADKVLVTREPEGGSTKPTEGALIVADLS